MIISNIIITLFRERGVTCEVCLLVSGQLFLIFGLGQL